MRGEQIPETAARPQHAARPGGRGAEAGVEPGRRPGAPPRRSSPPTSSEGAGLSGSPRPRAVQARGAAPRRLPLWLAAARRRSAPGSRRRAAGHGAAQGPPGGLGAQPVARYVSPVPPFPLGALPWPAGASGPAARSRPGCARLGRTLAALRDIGPPGSGCTQCRGSVKFGQRARRTEAT